MNTLFSSKITTKGFTLVEILLSVALMGILFGVMIPVYQSMQSQNNLSVSIDDYVTALSRAQTLSMNGESDSSWGVTITEGSIIIFQGIDYNSRDVEYDESSVLPVGITVSGVTEFVFDKMTGYPTTTGTTILTNQTGDTKEVTINTKGMVDYE